MALSSLIARMQLTVAMLCVASCVRSVCYDNTWQCGPYVTAVEIRNTQWLAVVAVRLTDGKYGRTQAAIVAVDV